MLRNCSQRANFLQCVISLLLYSNHCPKQTYPVAVIVIINFGWWHTSLYMQIYTYALPFYFYRYSGTHKQHTCVCHIEQQCSLWMILENSMINQSAPGAMKYLKDNSVLKVCKSILFVPDYIFCTIIECIAMPESYQKQ